NFALIIEMITFIKSYLLASEKILSEVFASLDPKQN
ncbi:hypothetical protein SAMN06265218_1421, partial [Fodinibius sediminis]